ncbi:hypothetical protein V8G54_034494 [Vigna mungo]|uniref:Uncharacterized protein n=1 Tax=Vigna mungo TaxID=3915 RepID=A0AAQ3MQV5_VIGMU
MSKESRLLLYPQQTTIKLGLLPPHPFFRAPIKTTLSLSQFTLANNAHNTFFAARPRSLTLHSHFLFNHKRKKKPFIMGMNGASHHDNVVLKSPNDRRLYRLLHLPNGLRALLVHDPEIYPEGPPKHAPEEDEVEEGEEDEDDEEEEEEEDDDDDEEEEEDDDDEEEEEDDDEGDGEKDGVKGGGGAAAQSKKVAFLLCCAYFGNAHFDFSFGLQCAAVVALWVGCSGVDGIWVLCGNVGM